MHIHVCLVIQILIWILSNDLIMQVTNLTGNGTFPEQVHPLTGYLTEFLVKLQCSSPKMFLWINGLQDLKCNIGIVKKKKIGRWCKNHGLFRILGKYFTFLRFAGWHSFFVEIISRQFIFTAWKITLNHRLYVYSRIIRNEASLKF